MSMTQSEKERRIAELHRLVADGWRDAKLQRVQAIRATNPDWDFDRVWSQAEREQQNPAPEPTSIGEAAKLVQAEHGWSFAESWDYAEQVYPKLVRSSTGEPLTRDPRLAQEMDKIKKLGDASRSATTGDHAEFLAKVRKLMTEQNLTFDQAFDTVIKEKHGIKTAAEEPKPSVHVEADGITEHPFLVEATRRGLMLVQGGFANPIFPKGTA